MKLGGSLTRQKEEDMTVSDASPHVANIGSMVEVSLLDSLLGSISHFPGYGEHHAQHP